MKVPVPVKEYKTLHAGNHFAICIMLIDLGTQKKEFAGQIKYLRQVRIGFETVDETAVFKEENGNQPFLLTKDLTLSMAEKSSLRLLLESWRGAKFKEEELQDYDLKNILGKTCLLNTVVNTSKDGTRSFSNINQATPVPKSMVREVEPVNPIVYFDLNSPDWNVFETFPDFVKDKIKASPEYKKAIGDQSEGEVF